MNLPEIAPKRAVNIHRRYHVSVAFERCWTCQRWYATCLSKVTYETREAAAAVALEINLREGLAEPVIQYPCNWGSKEQPHWHIAHARKGIELKRARRRVRRALLNLEAAS